MSLAIALVFFIATGINIGIKDKPAGLRILVMVCSLLVTGLCAATYGHIEGTREAIGHAVDYSILHEGDRIDIHYAKPMAPGSYNYYIFGTHNGGVRLIHLYDLPTSPCPGLMKVEFSGKDVSLVGKCDH